MTNGWRAQPFGCSQDPASYWTSWRAQATPLTESSTDPARCEQAIGRLEQVPFVWIQLKRTRRRIHVRFRASWLRLIFFAGSAPLRGAVFLAVSKERNWSCVLPAMSGPEGPRPMIAKRDTLGGDGRRWLAQAFMNAAIDHGADVVLIKP